MVTCTVLTGLGQSSHRSACRGQVSRDAACHGLGMRLPASAQPAGPDTITPVPGAPAAEAVDAPSAAPAEPPAFRCARPTLPVPQVPGGGNSGTAYWFPSQDAGLISAHGWIRGRPAGRSPSVGACAGRHVRVSGRCGVGSGRCVRHPRRPRRRAGGALGRKRCTVCSRS